MLLELKHLMDQNQVMLLIFVGLDLATGFHSHSRIAYYDLIASRPNLQLITGHLVEKILFDANLTPQRVSSPA